MNKKLYGLAVTAFVLSMVGGCSSKTDIKVNEKALTVELGDSISTEAKTYLTKNTDKDILKKTSVIFDKSNKYTVDQKKKTITNKEGSFLPVGNYKASLKYEDEQKNITVKVKDTKAPRFKDFKDAVSIEVGNTDDLATLFKAEDLSKVSITVKGKLDLTKEGSYEVKVTASDEYKNKTTKKATIKVVAKQAVADPVQPEANGSNNQGTTSGTGGSTSTGGGNTSSGGNTGGGNTGGSSNGDVCVPVDDGNVGIFFNSMEEADAYANAFAISKENTDKNFDGIPGGYMYTYAVFSAGCGKWILYFEYR